MRGWIGVCCMVIGSFANAGNGGAILGVVLDKVEAEQWDNARAFAAHSDDPMVGEILDWYELRAGQGDLTDYERFLSSNADWPGLPWLQAKGEAKLDQSEDADRTIAFIENLGAQTPSGAVAYITALAEKDDTKGALDAALMVMNDLEIPFAEMTQIQTVLPDLTDDKIRDHVHYLLDEDAHELARDYVEDAQEKLPEDGMLDDAWKVLEARLVIVENKGGIDEVLEALSEKIRNSPPLVFERVRHAFRQKDRVAAATLMREFSTSREALYKPHLYMEKEMRTRLAGDPLWAGDAKLAYETVTHHYMEKGEEGYALSEWLSGFIALEYLDQPDVALRHFQNFRDTAETPISLGRAGYWLGRAGDPGGYALGAKYQSSFYGQLSAEMAGIAPDMSLIDGKKPSYGAELYAKDSVHAGLLFYSADRPLLTHRFFAHEAETLSPEDAEALGLLALDLKVPHGTIGIGKNLAKRGEVITHSLYPIPELPTENLAVPKALTLAITRQESEFYQRAESWAGAKGYMQVMPATAEKVTEELGIEYNEAALKDDGAYNMTIGSAYAAEVGEAYGKRVVYIAAGYNAGPNRVKEWIKHMGEARPTVEDAVRWIEMIRFEETRNYAQRILEGTFIYDAKLNGEYRITPSELLLEAYW